MRTYTAVFGLAFVLALLATPLVIRLAFRLGAIDAPGPRRVHRTRVPRIGGLAFALPLVLSALAVFSIDNQVSRAFREVDQEIASILAASVFVLLVGLVDDLRGLAAWQKFAGQSLATVAVMFAGVVMGPIRLTESFSLDLGIWFYPITFLWIVGVTNAVNLIDGLDGLAAGISAISASVMAVLAILTGDRVLAILMLALLGALCGFLFYNFNPAKIFMGDSGSCFLGFLLGSSSVLTGQKTTTIVGLALPLLTLGVPIFDTLLAMLRRFGERRSPFSPDQEHVHHRLLRKGFGHRRAVLLLYTITAAAAGVGMLMITLRNQAALIVFTIGAAVLIAGLYVAGALGLRETVTSLGERIAHHRALSAEQSWYENTRLALLHAKTEREWRFSLESAAAALDLGVSVLPCSAPHDEEEFPRQPAGLSERDAHVVFVVGSVSSRLLVRVHARGDSSESAIRRASVLARVVEDVPPPLTPEASEPSRCSKQLR